jgi:hypothetical protein
MKKYKQYIESVSRTALTKPSDEEIEEAEEYLKQGADPDWDIMKQGYISIDVSGKYSVYYTMWRVNLKSDHFITNLSTDFKTAIQKAKKAAGRIPVLIDKYGTKSGLFQAARAEILTFGKYRGNSLGEIFIENPQYINWLYTKYDGSHNLPMDRLKFYNDLYFETITKKNLEESKSKYVGKIGDKITITADIYDFSVETSPFDGSTQYKCKLIDKEENKYMTYNIGKLLKKGDSVELLAKVKDHKELLGVKFTILYYCKILKQWNLAEDISKFNI